MEKGENPIPLDLRVYLGSESEPEPESDRRWDGGLPSYGEVMDGRGRVAREGFVV